MSKKKISQIWIYPVKSLGGIRMRTSRILAKGLEFDRRWMLIDEENQFMTQRIYPQMCLFKLTCEQGKFVIHHSGQSLELPFQSEKKSITARIWDDAIEVIEAGSIQNEWFSEKLKMNCRLVSFPEKNPRAVNPHYAINEDHVSLADSFPLLMIGQSSLDDLNQRLEEPVPMNRFRPNIVFTGGQPYEEDDWGSFKAGNNRFQAVKRCSRCVLTTVNQDTGEKGKEPLATLSMYRNWDGKVYFGQKLIPIDHLEINEGDEIDLES